MVKKSLNSLESRGGALKQLHDGADTPPEESSDLESIAVAASEPSDQPEEPDAAVANAIQKYQSHVSNSKGDINQGPDRLLALEDALNAELLEKDSSNLGSAFKFPSSKDLKKSEASVP